MNNSDIGVADSQAVRISIMPSGVCNVMTAKRLYCCSLPGTCVYENSVAPRKRVANEFPEGLCNTLRFVILFVGFTICSMSNVSTVREENNSSFDYQEKVETGRESGFIAVHVKSGGNKSLWPSTVDFEAADGSTYFLYWHPGFPYYDYVTVPSATGVLPFTDVYGEDDSIVLPPHKKGMWADIPNGLGHLTDKEYRLIVRDPAFEITNPPGVLQEATAKEFLHELLQAIQPDCKESVATLWSKFQQWNATYKVGPIRNLTLSIDEAIQYDEKELRKIFDDYTGIEDETVAIMNSPFPQPDGTSIYFLTLINRSVQTADNQADTGSRNGKAPSQAVRLVDMVLKNPKITLFKDDYSVAHVRMPIGDHSEVWPCKSSAFQRWLSSEFYNLTKGQMVIGRESAKDAIGLFEGRAINEGEEHKLYNRFGQTPDTIWYDLADQKWRAIKITKGGWDIATDVPPLFRRFSHLDPQVEPVRGGTVDEVLKFVNVTEEDQKILFLVHLVASFIPGWPHPALYVYGTQGSAKSTLSRIERKLIDPSKTEVVSMTRKENDLAQQLAHHSFLFFDNVSDIPDWIADLICRAITGSGFSKKELYTTDDDFITYVRTNIGINGINLASNRADLLERCLLLKLERMKVRKEEHQLMSDFELARPKILGAIFDAVAKAMTLRPSIKVDKLPRMADFASWGCAIAEALEIGQKAFLTAYARNINSQSEELINDSTVATLIKTIVDDRGGEWSSSPESLFTAFKNQAEAEKIVGGRLPASPSALMRELNRLKTPFEEMGYQITSASDRTVTIHKIAPEE